MVLAAVVLQVIELAVPLPRQYKPPTVLMVVVPLHHTAIVVEAGTPVQVRAAAVLVIATEAIVQTPMAVNGIPTLPSVTLPPPAARSTPELVIRLYVLLPEAVKLEVPATYMPVLT